MESSASAALDELLSKMKNPALGLDWQTAWKEFFEAYSPCLHAMCANSYRFHTCGNVAPDEVIEDAVATVIADFCSKSQHGFDPSKGNINGFFKTLCNARIIDYLRKETRMMALADCKDLGDTHMGVVNPDVFTGENEHRRLALLKSLIENLRTRISPRQFAIFEKVKLNGHAVDQVAAELGVRRGVIDNTIYRVMNVLREVASLAEFRSEWEN